MILQNVNEVNRERTRIAVASSVHNSTRLELSCNSHRPSRVFITLFFTACSIFLLNLDDVMRAFEKITIPPKYDTAATYLRLVF